MTVDEDRVAITGMAGRFPGAASVDELWRNLCAGVGSLRRFSAGELAADGISPALRGHPDHVPAGGDLAGADEFDGDFFGIPAHEARLIDPQHRLFLECAWRALEDAGHDPWTFPGRVGVFGSVSLSTYLLALLSDPAHRPLDGISYPLLLGNDKDFLSTRVSYRLGLTGPSVAVQTACSSSLVAVHLAVQSLLAGECDLALAGGSSVTFPQHTGYLYREGGILSRDGHCRVFDAAAGGTVKGNGCGVVVLRRLSDAVDGRDHIHAVIAGSAVNNDGDARVGYTAPGVTGQVQVIREALAVSGVPAADIGYVETHGTGTALGDPVELTALARAHAADGPPPAACRIGSVKANLGHLDVAAGVAGLMKTALVLREQVTPGQLDFATPNPGLVPHLDRYRIDPGTGPAGSPIRAAGVSSFGMGGTNAHAVLVPAPPTVRPAATGGYLMLLSARDNTALAALAGGLADWLREHPAARLDDVAYTLAAGRSRFPVRAAVRSGSVAHLIDRLSTVDPAGPPPSIVDGDGVATRWLAGEDVEPDEVGDVTHARRVPLPGYPLRPVRHWDPAASGPSPARPTPTAETRTAETPAAETPPGPTGDLTGLVTGVVGGMLALTDLGPDDDIYEAGLDSMRAVELVTALRDASGRPLSFEEFDGLRTVREIADTLAGADRPGPTLSTVDLDGPTAFDPNGFRHLLVKVRSGDDGQVFLVHAAGGSTTTYVDFARHVADPRTLWGIGFPGEQKDRLRTVRELARLYVALIREVQPAGPYVLGGYSFGGNVALEMAAVLESAGEKVEQIIMFDSHPPEAYVGGQASDSDFLAAFPALIRAILPELDVDTDAVPATLADAVAMVRMPDWTDAVAAELARFFAIWQHNHEALKRWYPDRPVNADVTVFAATEAEDPTILRRLSITWLDRETWARHTEGTLRVVPVAGDHYSMLRDPDCLASAGAAYDDLLSTLSSASSPGVHP